MTADYEAFHFNTMIAKLMELANLLMRYRGTAVAGSAEWDEAVRLPLLMLAPAAPHITEELWSRRLAAAGDAVVVDPRGALARGRSDGRRRGDPRGPGPGQRQAPRPGHGRRPDISTADLEAAVLASERIQAVLAGRRAAQGHPGRRRQARQHRRPGRRSSGAPRRRAPRAALPATTPDAAGSRPTSTGSSPSTRRSSRRSSARSGRRSGGAFPDAIEQVDFGNKLIAFGRSMKIRGLLFAIIAHRATSTSSSPTARTCPIPTG